MISVHGRMEESRKYGWTGQSHGSKLVSPKFWGHEDISTAVLSREVKSGGDEHGGHAASRGSEPV